MDITRENIEQLLDAGKVEVLVYPKLNRWWTARRNGKTQTWKRDRDRIRIPIKAGFRSTGAITEDDFYCGVLDCSAYRIKVDG